MLIIIPWYLCSPTIFLSMCKAVHQIPGILLAGISTWHSARCVRLFLLPDGTFYGFSGVHCSLESPHLSSPFWVNATLPTNSSFSSLHVCHHGLSAGVTSLSQESLIDKIEDSFRPGQSLLQSHLLPIRSKRLWPCRFWRAHAVAALLVPCQILQVATVPTLFGFSGLSQSLTHCSPQGLWITPVKFHT